MPTSDQVKMLYDSELMTTIEPILDSLAVYRQRAAEYKAMFTAGISGTAASPCQTETPKAER